jgi:arginase
LLEVDRIPLVLGGDHFVSWPIVRAIRKKHPKLTVLHFDAHPDLYDSFDGDRNSHACPFARIMEENLADRLVQVGVRTLNPPQRQQAERFGVEQVEMRHWRPGRIPRLNGPLYISIDVDVLDPAFAPGVSHPEPGGMSTRELIAEIQGLSVEIVGADIVELNPEADANGLTAVVCAKLVKELVDAFSRGFSRGQTP